MITEIHNSPTRGPRYQAIVHLFPQLQAYHSGIDMLCHEIAPLSQKHNGFEGVGKATEHIPDGVVSPDGWMPHGVFRSGCHAHLQCKLQ